MMFLYVTLIFLFFFFKQKTAYDMRISDWSSDVCSSDLSFGYCSCNDAKSDMNTQQHPTQVRGGLGCRYRSVLLARLNASAKESFDMPENKIGRASCRERVCKYV